jgi:hypothetical protein
MGVVYESSRAATLCEIAANAGKFLPWRRRRDAKLASISPSRLKSKHVCEKLFKNKECRQNILTNFVKFI